MATRPSTATKQTKPVSWLIAISCVLILWLEMVKKKSLFFLIISKVVLWVVIVLALAITPAMDKFMTDVCPSFWLANKSLLFIFVMWKAPDQAAS